MNIQLVVNGVDLGGTYREIGTTLNENSVKRLCSLVKDAFPLCFIHRGDLSTHITYGGQDVMLAVTTPMGCKVFVCNCMAQAMPVLAEVKTLNGAWKDICEHLLQTCLENIFNPGPVLEVID